MKTVKVCIEKAENGYSAYMEDSPMDYSCIGEGNTVDETIKDFLSTYSEMRDYYKEVGKRFDEVEFQFVPVG